MAHGRLARWRRPSRGGKRSLVWIVSAIFALYFLFNLFTSPSEPRIYDGPHPPPNWRSPGRDVEAEYQAVLEAVPELGGTRRARLAFLVMAHGSNDIVLLKRSIPWLYSKENFILIHLDRKTPTHVREDLKTFLSGLVNVRMLEPSLDVSWGGFSITLTAIFGLSTLVQWSTEWDYFINLSASDFPLLSSAEMGAVLGPFVERRVNFMTGSVMMESNRAERYSDDQGLYRVNHTHKAGNMFSEPGKPSKKVVRPLPTLFTLFKGEFWVALTREFCVYVHESPDNVARSLQAYFAKFRISDESFFQTTLCHPNAHKSFPAYNNNLRHISWPYFNKETEWVLHPDPVDFHMVPKLMKSGAIFARKFSLGTSDTAWGAIEDLLNSGSRRKSAERVRRVLARAAPARKVTSRGEFCTVPRRYSLQKVLDNPIVKVERKSTAGKH
ncbi:unnamed protein product [Choristocarpus tenellus]